MPTLGDIVFSLMFRENQGLTLEDIYTRLDNIVGLELMTGVITDEWMFYLSLSYPILKQGTKYYVRRKN